jgi:large subunit ribosomal protein L9
LRVVFLDDVDGVARAGEVKNVADGYARNFLLPRKLAAAATTSTMQQADKRSRALAKEQDKLDEAAQAVAVKLGASPLVIAAKVGELGRLFGSVTASDIAEAVSAHSGSTLEHRQVSLATPIKEVGTYEVSVILTRNVKAQLTVQVKSDAEEDEAPAPKAAARAKRASAKKKVEDVVDEADEADKDEDEEEA